MCDSEYEQRLREKLEKFSLTDGDKNKIVESFLAVDKDRSEYLDRNEILDAFEAVDKKPAQYKLRVSLQQFDRNQDGRLSVEEFAQVYSECCADTQASGFLKAVKTNKKIVKTSGTEGTRHSYSPEEMVAFCNWINQNLKNDPDLAKYNLPINPENPDDFFNALIDGVILCKMINLSQKDTIDERAINTKKHAPAVQIHKDQENINLALNSASAIGCSIVNIGAQDIKNKKAHLILGLLWQVIRIGLFAAFDLTRTPDLGVLLEDGETLDDLMNLSPEALLLRWINYHLDKSEKYKAMSGDKITNFSSDIKDSYAYMCLLEQIQPQPGEEGFTDDMIVANVNAYPGKDEENRIKRASYMLNEADKINCRAFVTEYDVAKGNAKLNLAFVANLFNTYPCLHDTTERDFVEETREEKTHRNWMNSLGVSPRVYRLNNDLKDGLVLFQLYENIRPGITEGKNVNKPPFTVFGGKMKKIENCNKAIELAHQCKYSIVGIGGTNIHDGDKMLTLALTWQLMRDYTLSVLSKLGSGLDAKDRNIENIIVSWANQTVNDDNHAIQSFKDKKISTSIPVIKLIEAIVPKSIDFSNVTDGVSEEDKKSNAKYAISMARKIGARVYALPEDLWEVTPKMVLTVYACLMARFLEMRESASDQ